MGTEIKSVEAKSLKTFYGHDMMPMVQCNFYINGKKAFHYSEDCWGGCPRIHFYPESPVGERELEQWVKDQKLKTKIEDEEYDMDLDMYLAERVTDAIVLRDCKKNSKTKTVIKTEDGKILLYKIPYNEKSRQVVISVLINQFWGKEEKTQVMINGKFIKLSELIGKGKVGGKTSA